MMLYFVAESDHHGPPGQEEKKAIVECSFHHLHKKKKNSIAICRTKLTPSLYLFSLPFLRKEIQHILAYRLSN